MRRSRPCRPSPASASRATPATGLQNLMDQGAGAMRYVMARYRRVITFGIVYNSARIAYAERARDLGKPASHRLLQRRDGLRAAGRTGASVTLAALPVGVGAWLLSVLRHCRRILAPISTRSRRSSTRVAMGQRRSLSCLARRCSRAGWSSVTSTGRISSRSSRQGSERMARKRSRSVLTIGAMALVGAGLDARLLAAPDDGRHGRRSHAAR